MLIYLDAQSDKCYQFAFRADWLDVLRKGDKIKQAFEKRYPDYKIGEMTLDKNPKCREIRASLIKKESGFKFA